MEPPLNVPIKTAGGTQLWTDHVWRDGWRIQQNAWTGHWRLLDEKDVRRAWGSRETCTDALDRAKPANTKPADTEPADAKPADTPPRVAVVLLHGLMRTHRSMLPVEQALREADPPLGRPFDVIRFSYASSRRSIADHAEALAEALNGIPNDSEFCFVGHSMGNIVVRHLIGDLQRHGDPQSILDRSRAMVMIGPPNQGAAIARRLSSLGIFGVVTGPGGLELGPEWDALSVRLAVPPFPFAIVAGDRSESPVRNPLVEPRNDFIVSVDEAKLDGAEKFETVDALHSFMMRDEQVTRFTADFLRSHL